MKNLIVTIVIKILALLLISNPSNAQSLSKLQFGLFAGYGKDDYTRKLKGAAGIPGATNHFESKSSIELGIYLEKFLTSRISAMPKIYYSSQNVPANTLCNCSHLDHLQKERHHIASLGLGFRGYLTRKAAMKAFSGFGLSTDYFLGYTEKRNDNTSFHWSAQGYNKINPGVSGELGLQWRRIGLLGEYKSNLANTFSKGYQLSNGEEIKRSIFRQGYSVKMSFLLTKPPLH